MSKKNSKIAWIETGYELFAEDGLEGIQVERLARITGLNKSGYYHYFGDRDSFLVHLMKHHVEKAHLVFDDMSLVKQFDPDFFQTLLKHKETVMVHKQLVRNRHNQLLNEVYLQVNEIVEPAVMPSWAAFLEIPNNPELAHKYFKQVRDMFYARVTLKTMNYDFLRVFLHEAKSLLQEAIRQNSPIPQS